MKKAKKEILIFLLFIVSGLIPAFGQDIPEYSCDWTRMIISPDKETAVSKYFSLRYDGFQCLYSNPEQTHKKLVCCWIYPESHHLLFADYDAKGELAFFAFDESQPESYSEHGILSKMGKSNKIHYDYKIKTDLDAKWQHKKGKWKQYPHRIGDLWLDGYSHIDSLTKYFSFHEIIIERINPGIKYNGSPKHEYYTLSIGDKALSFRNNIRRNKYYRSASLNDEELTIISEDGTSYEEINIDYNESDIYRIDGDCYLIISNLNGWDIQMTSFRFYQLVDTKKRTVREFINFGNSPYVLIKTESGLELIYVDGDYDKEKGEWEVKISEKDN